MSRLSLHRNGAVSPDSARIAVVIPAYNVAAHLAEVIRTVPEFVEAIFVVDDACPANSGNIADALRDTKVRVLRHERNRGVGGATMSGYSAALEEGFDVVVKIDGDGQMDPAVMIEIVDPILAGEADYTKGNRFYDLTYIGRMPRLRIVGNAILSFLAKASTGYWDILDPTNGYTAIHATALRSLDMRKVSERYFFETDLLFRLNLLRAVVVDVPIDARYGDEVSNLKISRIIGEFAFKHVRNLCKRIFYNYVLRDFTIATLELIAALVLISSGVAFGIIAWVGSIAAGTVTSAGTVMLSALPIMLGLQLLLAFLAYDMGRIPRRPLSKRRRGVVRG